MTKARNLSKLASVNTSIVGNTVYISGNVSLANATLSLGANTINSTSLTSTGVVANSYGNTTAIPVITVDAAGRITNATTSSVSGVTGLSFAPANSTITVSTSTTNFDAVVTSGNSTVQGLLTVIDSVSNTSTLIAGSANSVTTAYLLAANAVSNATAAYSNAVSYANTIAGTAYSNAVSYANTIAGTAYSNATSYADTVASTAYSNAVSVAASDATSKAGTAYSNAIATAASDATSKAGTAYSNAISYANTAAGTAYSNAISYANTVAYTAAGTAYSNVFNGGTFSGAVTVQANLTANSVRMNGDLQIDGNLTVSGNSVTINVTNLNVDDNMIYLNSNSTVSHPDLGFAGNYNDGSYQHAGLFRDATDGVWKFFHGYTPEPDASAFIDTANASFTFSNLQINYVIGNVTGSANSATYLGGNTASTLRTYSDTIAGTAYSNATTYAATIAGTAYSNATSYAATIAGTAYSNAVSVAASDATTKAGTAYSNATTYAATVAGTAYSNAVSVAASDATTKAGTAYSNAVASAASLYPTKTGTGASGTWGINITGSAATATDSTKVAKTGDTMSGPLNITGNSSYVGDWGYSTLILQDTSGYPGVNWRSGSNNWLQRMQAGGSTMNWGYSSNASAQGVGGYTEYLTLSTTLLQHPSSMRAPIFYDSADTGYFTDPNSTSCIRKTNLIASGSGWDDGLNLYSSDATNRWNFLVDNGAADVFRLAYNNSEALQISTDRNIRAIVDFRAPIFYDSNDTGYYVNPNSSSFLSSLAINGDFRTTFVSGAGGSTFSANHYSMGKDIANGGWSHPHYSDLIIGYHTGIRIGGTYSGVRFYANSPTTDANNDGNGDGGEALLMTVGGYVGTANSTDVYVNNNLFAGSSMRAPIYYDSDNTSYYTNPAGASVVSDMRINDGNVQIRAGNVNRNTKWRQLEGNSDVGISFYNAADTWCMQLYADGGSNYGFLNGNWASWDFRKVPSGNLFLNNQSTYYVNGSEVYMNRVYGVADIRSPLYYDNNDTGYYVDPNATSRFVSTIIGGHGGTAYDTASSGRLWFGTTADNAYSVYTAMENVGGNYTKLTLDWHTGIRIGAYPLYGGVRFYNNSIASSGSKIFSVGESDSNVKVYNDIRSPIYYDLDDTGYYINPNSTSVMNRISTVRTNDWLYLDNNYGHSIVGVYSASRYQGVFAMGDSYKLAADGTTTGNLYGMAWSHPNAGGIAGNLTDHGLLIINNGGFRCAISNSIVAAANITAYSDERLKTNWRDMPENYVVRLAQVKVGIYDRIDQDAVTQVGVSAQSFQKLLPQAIQTAKDDMQTLSVSYGNAALASAVELAKEVVLLKETISSQEARIAKLEALINKLAG